MTILQLLLSTLFMAVASAASCDKMPTAPTYIMNTFLKLVQNEGTKQPTLQCYLDGKAPGFFTPINVARGIHSVSLAMYNVWSRCDDQAKTTVKSNVERMTVTGKQRDRAMAVAGYLMMKYLLPEATELFDVKGDFEEYFDISLKNIDSKNDPKDHIGAANILTNILIEELMEDGFNAEDCYEDTSGFVPINDPVTIPRVSGEEDTARANLAANRDPTSWSQIIVPGAIETPRTYLNPHAAAATPFIIRSPLHYLPAPLNRTTEYFMEAMQVVVDHQADLEDDDGRKKLIAEFWADGPDTTLPPGHWTSIALEVLEKQCAGRGATIKALFLLSGALYDSGLAAWAAKRYYNSARPVAYITSFMKDENLKKAFQGPYCPLGKIKGWQWQPYQANKFVTPPFPEYVSGHSSFSGAAAVILRKWFGTDEIPGGSIEYVIKRGESLFEYYCSADGLRADGQTKCEYTECLVDSSFNSENNFVPKEDVTLGPWETFTELADEAGISRLYGGIHIDAGNDEGLRLGKRIGRKVFRSASEYFTGERGY